MAKHRRISEAITAAIRRGEYVSGQKLPTERELADMFGVHRMTVRQATATLAANGLVVKRLPAGVFVREEAAATRRRINLVCPAGDSVQGNSFIRQGVRRAAERGLQARVLRLYSGDEHLAAEAIAAGDPTLLISVRLDRRGPLMREARRAADRLVVIGGRLDHAGIASIIGDDELGLKMAVEYLHDRGHDRIALVCSMPGDSLPLMEVQVQQFRHAVELVGCGRVRPQEVLRLDDAAYEQGPVAAAAQAVRDYLQRCRAPATAFVGLSEEVTHGTASALHALGRRVPEDASLLAYSATPLSAYAIPPYTGVEIGIREHIDAALDWIDARAQAGAEAGDRPPLLRVVAPRLVERQSVADAGEGTGGGDFKAATSGRRNGKALS